MAKHRKSNGNHGGHRPGAGRPKSTALVPESMQAQRQPARADLNEVLALIQASKTEVAARRAKHVRPYQLPAFPPTAQPPEPLRMAMDDNSNWANGLSSLDAGTIYNNYGAEGLLFPGYTYLSELAQRPEYRILAETIPDDATRKWIKFEIAGNDDEVIDRKAKDAEDPGNASARREQRVEDAGLSEKVKKIEEYLEMLHARERCYDLAVGDNLFGRMHLHFNFAKDGGLEPESVLKTSIGDGYDRISRARVTPKTPLQNLKVIEPVWTYPMAYNATNPLLENWYNPQYWYVLGQELHTSRLMPFTARPVPDILKPSYAFGGLSMSQIAEPYVNIWLRTRQSVADMIHSFSVMILATDLSSLMQPGGASDLLARIGLFNAMRDNQGSYVVNKQTEEVKNVAAPLGGLDHLQAQAQEHMASVSRIPLVKLTGISPSGLNASSEGEIRVYYDTVNAFQERKLRPVLNRIINFVQLSMWGEIDERLTYIFEPLQEMTGKERAEIQKSKAERDQIYVSGGAISAEEWRGAIINDPELPYADLNPEDVPEPPEQPGGELGEEDDGNDAGSAQRKPPAKEGGQANDIDPFFGLDAEWKEGDHPRAPDGKFGSGGGGSSGGSSSGSAMKPTFKGWEHKKPLSPSNLTKIGPKMGSNDGGTFKDSATGKEFYIKKPETPAHVTNELLGAKLYQMTGGHTLNYHPVEGGKHVATELAKLDVNNVNKFTPAEKKQAQKDFMVQAWIGNWDAAGTGGDNKGILNGKPTALDFGGALEYRAQGQPKGDAFGPDATVDVVNMLNASKRPDNAKLYGSMTGEEKKESAKKVTDLTNDEIITAVKESGGTATLAQKLIDRKASLANAYGLPTDTSEWDDNKHPRNPDGTFAKGTGSEETKSEKPATSFEEEDGVPAAGAYGGLWKGGSSPQDTFELNANHYAQAKSQIGIHYRRMMTKMLKDADKYGIDDQLKQKIKGKLVESLKASASKALAQGKSDEVLKLAKAINALTGGYVPPAPEPAPAAATTNPAENVKKFSPKFAAAVAEIEDEKDSAPASALKKTAAAVVTGDATAEALGAMLSPNEKKWLTDVYGTVQAAYNAAVNKAGTMGKAVEQYEKQTSNSEFAQNLIKQSEEKAASEKKSAFKAKFDENMASKDASYKTPINIAKQKVKAAAQTGIDLPALLSEMTAEEAKALGEQYGTVANALKKSQEYVAAEKQQVMQAAEATTKAATLAQKQKNATDAQKAAAIKTKEEIAEKIAKATGHEIMKDVVGSYESDTYKQKAQSKIKAAGYSKYITADDAVPILAYTSSHYSALNAQIREGVMEKDQYLFMKTLNAALNKLPPYTEKTYRKASLTKEQFDAYKAGNIVEERSFTSSAKVEGVWSGNYHYEIYGKSGRDISKLSVQGTSEQEVLFPAGSRFVVERVEGNKIVMHEVD